MLRYFIDQDNFFKKLDYTMYNGFRNKLCGLINIFIILKNSWIIVSENEILSKALELNSYDKDSGWRYEWLVKLLKQYWIKASIINTKIFHYLFLKKIFLNLNINYELYIASIKTDFNENHLILIEKFTNNNIYYKSVWTEKNKSICNWVIHYDLFKKIYNKRGILIKINH